METIIMETIVLEESANIRLQDNRLLQNIILNYLWNLMFNENFVRVNLSWIVIIILFLFLWNVL